MNRPIVLLLALAPLVAAARGGDDEDAAPTLPPIRTTTSTSTTTTTIATERRFYEVKPGETLSIIAREFAVPLQAIIDLNGIENPDAIAAGEVIEIPSGVVLVTELPTTVAPSSAP